VLAADLRGGSRFAQEPCDRLLVRG
jgi:hypothetical protein